MEVLGWVFTTTHKYLYKKYFDQKEDFLKAFLFFLVLEKK